MLRLKLSAEPEWLELAAGVRVLVAACTSAVIMAARNDPEVEALPEDASNEARAIAVAKAVGRIVVMDWDGVGDLAGNPIPVTGENVALLLDVYPIFEKFQLLYMMPGLALESEKNVSAPAPSGTSAGATPTARPARAGAKPARRASTAPKASKAGRSGTSRKG